MKLNELKVELAKQILQSENMDELQLVDRLLNPTRHFKLTAAQKEELDRGFEEYTSGKARTYSPQQLRARALNAMRTKKHERGAARAVIDDLPTRVKTATRNLKANKVRKGKVADLRKDLEA